MQSVHQPGPPLSKDEWDAERRQAAAKQRRLLQLIIATNFTFWFVAMLLIFLKP